eukprot:Platyproteum_vivax@DN5285_c0_g1_i1.p1
MYQNQQTGQYVQYGQSPRVVSNYPYALNNSISGKTPTTLYRQADGTLTSNPPSSIVETPHGLPRPVHIPVRVSNYPTMMQSESTVRLGNQNQSPMSNRQVQYVYKQQPRQDISPSNVANTQPQQSPPAFYHILQAVGNGMAGTPTLPQTLPELSEKTPTSATTYGNTVNVATIPPTPIPTAFRVPDEDAMNGPLANPNVMNGSLANPNPMNGSLANPMNASLANPMNASLANPMHASMANPINASMANPIMTTMANNGQQAHLTYEGIVNLYSQVKRNCDMLELKRIETQKDLEVVQQNADKQAAVYAANLQEKEKELEILEKDLVTYRKSCEEARVELLSKEEEISRLQLEFSQMPSEAMSLVEIQMHVDARTAALQADCKTHREEMQRLKRDLGSNSKTLAAKEKNICEMRMQVERASMDLKMADEQVRIVKEQEETFKKQLKAQQKEMQRLKAVGDEARKELEDALEKHSAANAENEVKEKELQTLKDKMRLLKTSQQRTDNKNADAAAKLSEMQAAESLKNEEIAQMKAHIKHLSTEMKQKETAVRKQAEKEAQNGAAVYAEVTQMRQDVSKLRESLDKKQEEFDKERQQYEFTIEKISTDLAGLENQLAVKENELQQLRVDKVDFQAMLSEKIEQLPNNVKFGEYTMRGVRDMVHEISGLQNQITDLMKLVEAQQQQLQSNVSLDQSLSLRPARQLHFNSCSHLPPPSSAIGKRTVGSRSAAEFHTPLNKSPARRYKEVDTSLSTVEEARVTINTASEDFASKRQRFLNL